MPSATPAVALSRPRTLVAASLAAAALALALVVPQTALAATSTPTVAELTQRVVDDTNAVRAQQGLPALVRDPRLDKVGAEWAKQQFENGAMSHNPNYSTQIPPGWQRAGENVGKGYTATQIVEAWKNSSSHYANLVNDYTSVGVGYYEQDGRRYWSQVFAKYPGTVPPVPSSGPAPAQPTPTPSSGTSGSTASPAAEPDAPAGSAVALSSPSFESGLGAWSAPSGTVDGPNSAARGGTHSLVVPGASGRVVAQTVSAAVAAGSTHTLTVWVKADGRATGTVRLRALGGAAEAAAMNFTASDAGWLKVPVALTVNEAHTGFALEVVTPQSGLTYRLDAVSLVRTGGPAAPAPAPAPSPAPTPGTPPAPQPEPIDTPSPVPTEPEPAEPAPAPSPTAPALLDLGILRIGRLG